VLIGPKSLCEAVFLGIGIESCQSSFMNLSQKDLNGKISDHQQSWGYEDGPWKGPGPPLPVAADLEGSAFN
jgi:hypothetical protein